LRLLLLKQIPEDADLRRQWNELVARTAQPQVFYTYEWALAVQRAYAETLHPLLFLAYDERDSISGLVALARTDGEQVSFLCATTGDYCDFISLPENKQDFIASVLAELKKQGTGKVVLTNLPDDSDTVPALRQASSQYGLHYFARTAYVCAQISLAKLERRPQDNRLVLPRQKMVRRFLKAMGQESPVRLDHARSWEQVEPALPEFMHAHVARFLATGRISNLARPERRLFLQELAKLLSDSGWLAFTRLISGKNSLAWNYGFQSGDTWFWYQPTFDSDLEKYSPGFCTLSQLIEEAATDGAFATVDLGLGDEGYKERFANQTRRTLYVRLGTSAYGHFRELMRYGLSAAVRAVPAAERAVRSLHARQMAFRRRVHQMGARETWTWVAKRVESAVVARDEVYFYELTNPDPALLKADDVFLKTIDLNTLATAVLQNSNDEGTLAYLLRCADRLRTDAASVGFALTNAAGELLHFTWAGPFENFHWSELDSGLPSPAPGSVILFDSWTPVSQRGRGHYAPTLARVVARMRQEGKRSWGFSASTNTPSVRGLEKAGFPRCFSVLRYRLLWWQKLVQKNAAEPSKI